jgi:predicted lipoprotein with Yx(FWY)xxD motif
MGARTKQLVAVAGGAACGLALALGAAGAAVRTTVISTDNPKLGTIVVSSTGRTVYHFLDDRGKKVACVGACAKLWPPVLIAKSAKPAAGTGITASKLGTITRPDGTVQVTYNGYPLYRYTGDTKNGQVNGQGFEKLWYVLAPSGAVIKLSASAASDSGSTSANSNAGSTSTSTSTSGGGYGGYGSGY